jgi:hypothetical protein
LSISARAFLSVVIAGLDPAIHEALQGVQPEGWNSSGWIMDAGVKPGHDAECVVALEEIAAG